MAHKTIRATHMAVHVYNVTQSHLVYICAEKHGRTWCGEVVVEISSCAAECWAAGQTANWRRPAGVRRGGRRPEAPSPPRYDRCCPCTTSPACLPLFPCIHTNDSPVNNGRVHELYLWVQDRSRSISSGARPFTKQLKMYLSVKD